MKRFLALALCAAALAALLTSSTLASVSVSLNLFPVDPQNLGAGGNWTLVAKTNTLGSQGIVGLTWRLSNFDPSGAESVHPAIGHEINGGVLKTGVFGGNTEFVYGQIPGIGIPPLVFGVGLSTSPSLLPVDPLGDPTWDDSSVIATGTVPSFPALPAFTLVAANETVGGNIVAASTGLTVVRVVPEPATLVLGAVAFAAAHLRRKR